jgi:DNA-binding NtrC family response regulator
VRLPPLRERQGDVVFLAGLFLDRAAARRGRPAPAFSRRVRRALEAYRWPGNVRELENVIERATLLEDGAEVTIESLPDDVLQNFEFSGPIPAPRFGSAAEGEVVPLEVEERRLILRALEKTGWDTAESARLLGVSRATIYRKIERYGLSRGG